MTSRALVPKQLDLLPSADEVKREQARLRMARTRKRRRNDERWAAITVPESLTEDMLIDYGFLRPEDADDPAAFGKALRDFFLDAVAQYVARNSVS